MKKYEESPLPEKPEGMAPEHEERWDTFQLMRLERRRARAERRMRGQQWLEQKKSAWPLFAHNMSNKELRAYAWRQLMDGDQQAAVIANELLKLRRKIHGKDRRDGGQGMNARVYALALKYRSTLYTIDNVNRETRAKAAKRKAEKDGWGNSAAS